MDEKPIPEFTVPMPGDRRNGFLGALITDENGQITCNIKFTEPGRHTITMRETVSGVSASQTIEVHTDCKCKADIRTGNRIAQSKIRTATTIEQIQHQVEISNLYINDVPEHLKEEALRAFEKTSEIADKRIEKLRTTAKNGGFSLKADGVEVNLGYEKSKIL